MNPQYAYQSAPMNMPMFAGGGLADAAQNLAAKGRQGDSMLVHMTPGEVKGLQALAMAHGGTLTTNPDTGLPEANFLKRLLPTLLGVGASFLFPAAAPWMIGAGIGGIETLRTGDLGKGLMAGLGAFGGAGLGSALASAGSAAPGAMASNLGVQGAATGAGSQAAQLAAQNAGFGQAGLEATRQAAASAVGANMAAPLTTSQLAFEGVKNLGTSQGLSNLATGLGQAFPSTTAKFAAATPGVMGVSEAFSPKFAPPAIPQEKSTYAGPYVPSSRSVRFKPEEDQTTSEFSFFSPSNPVPGYQPLYAAAGGSIDPDYNMEVGQNAGFSDRYALGGLTALAGGRYLNGPGDGTSDSIPATIGNKQPARLADGEFVIDARTVSEIGNGSSNAGAKKLYNMMDRVHAARKQAKRGQDTKAERYMPA